MIRRTFGVKLKLQGNFRTCGGAELAAGCGNAVTRGAHLRRDKEQETEKVSSAREQGGTLDGIFIRHSK
jgi:hypothetical protein